MPNQSVSPPLLIAYAPAGIALWASSMDALKEIIKIRSIRKCCRLHKQEGEHTDLLLSPSESLVRRLRIDQRECLLGEEHRDHERDGGRRSTEGLPCSSSSTLETIGGNGDACEGLWLLSRFFCTLSQRFFDISSWGTLALLFSRFRLRDWYRCGRGLGEQDHDSVSDDGGRTLRIGMEMGSAMVISGGGVTAMFYTFIYYLELSASGLSKAGSFI